MTSALSSYRSSASSSKRSEVAVASAADGEKFPAGRIQLKAGHETQPVSITLALCSGWGMSWTWRATSARSMEPEVKLEEATRSSWLYPSSTATQGNQSCHPPFPLSSSKSTILLEFCWSNSWRGPWEVRQPCAMCRAAGTQVESGGRRMRLSCNGLRK
eukprot:466440-Hanusia_phi.AAC.3